MSGHSKWHNIQGKKGKADAMRSNLFTKYAHYITVAAREGGGDLETNFSLRLAIEKAKSVNMPKDNIERAIKRGTGELKDDAIIQEIIYEGYGPGGIAVLIEAITDNGNRTVGELKNIFSKYGGTLGGPGSVKWQFVHQGVVRLDENQKSKIKNLKSDYELALIDAGAGDLIESEFGLEIRCPRESFQKILEIVRSFGVEPASAGLEWVAKEEIKVGEDEAKKMAELFIAFEELDDVKEVYTNEA